MYRIHTGDLCCVGLPAGAPRHGLRSVGGRHRKLRAQGGPRSPAGRTWGGLQNSRRPPRGPLSHLEVCWWRVDSWYTVSPALVLLSCVLHTCTSVLNKGYVLTTAAGNGAVSGSGELVTDGGVGENVRHRLEEELLSPPDILPTGVGVQKLHFLSGSCTSTAIGERRRNSRNKRRQPQGESKHQRNSILAATIY